MAKKTHSRKSKFTPEQRERAARESMKEPDRDVVARYPGLSKNTLQNWRARLGLKKPVSARGSTAPVSRKKKRGEVPGAKRRARTKGNGKATFRLAEHTNGASLPSLESAVGELVEAQRANEAAQHANTRALATLRAVREAYLRVFGGG